MTELALASGFIASAIISLLVISNPISTSAVFIALTQRLSHRKKIVLARRSIRFSLAILIFFSLTGLLLFQLFGISLGAFRIAGGILLFTTAVKMFTPRPASKHTELDYQDVAIIPLAIPFTAGPGTIVTVVVLMSEALTFLNSYGTLAGLLAILGVYAGILAIVAVSYLMMANSERVHSVFREGGRLVMSRLMGLLVMAIAVQFIINGMLDLVPVFLEAVNGG